MSLTLKMSRDTLGGTEDLYFKPLSPKALNSLGINFFITACQHQIYYVPSESDELYHVQLS